MVDAPKELKLFESFLSQDSLSEIKSEHQSLLTTYHEDVSGLTITDDELDCLVRTYSDDNHKEQDCLTGNLPDDDE